jgi:hypothetical protein
LTGTFNGRPELSAVETILSRFTVGAIADQLRGGRPAR